MNNKLKLTFALLGGAGALTLAHQAYCRVAPLSDDQIARKAYEHSAEGRGYDSYEEFLKAGVMVKKGAHNILSGVSEYDVYFTNRNPRKRNSLEQIELVKFKITSCGRVLKADTMTMGDLKIDQREFLEASE